MDREELKKKHLCEKHFTDNDYKTEKKRYLNSTAIPKKYFEDEDESSSGGFMKVKTPSKTYSNQKRILSVSPSTAAARKKLKFNEELEKKNAAFVEEILSLPDMQMTPRKMKLKKRIRAQTVKIKKYKKQLINLKQKVQTNKLLQYVFPLLAFLSTFAKTLVIMQLKGKSRKIWNSQERELSIAIFYKSPSTYLFLRRHGVILPSVSTIRRWISANLFKTGIDEGVKKILKLKCAGMSAKERKCVLAFDEISIKDLFEYNKKLDLVEGFEDLGHLGRAPKTATHAVVFMLKGLYKNWKFPISYYFSNGPVKKEPLKELLTYNLKTLSDIGFIPRVVVCDQGTNNQGVFRLLGVSKHKPHFTCNKSKIFALFDVPHLFKSIRNNLVSSVFKLNEKVIDFNIIKKTVEIDQSSASGRTLTKITEKHLDPNPFEKMSCKLALQVFSKTMAAAIKTCVSIKKIPEKLGTDTAEFVLILNNLFDALNSERLFDKNAYKCGLNDSNLKVKGILEQGREIFDTISKTVKIRTVLKPTKTIPKKIEISKTKEANEKYTRPPCFDGMVQTIAGILKLFEEEKAAKNSFLLTKRLNQDCLEIFFSIIRQRGGWNLNPSAKAFRLSFRILSITSLLKPSKLANCQEDSDTLLLLTNMNKTVHNIREENDNRKELDDTERSSIDLPDDEESFTALDTFYDIPCYNKTEESEKRTDCIRSTLEENANSYYAGYLIKKVKNKFNCSNCFLSSSISFPNNIVNPEHLFISYKNYGGSDKMYLEVPQDETIKFVHHAYLETKKYFEKFKDREFIGLKIKNKIIIKNLHWLGKKEDPCYKHKLFFIEHLVTTNIFKFCKWYKCSKKSFKQKEKNLKNK